MHTYVAGFYGLCVVASGLMRYFLEPGGETGLWFGIVFGLLAWIAALCFGSNKTGIARALLSICVVFVGGWFFYEALIKKGFADAELRMLFLIVLSVIVAVVTWMPADQSSKSAPGDP